MENKDLNNKELKRFLQLIKAMIICSNISKYSSIIALILIIISVVFLHHNSEAITEELFSSFIDKVKNAFIELNPIVIAAACFTILEAIASIAVIKIARTLKASDYQQIINKTYYKKIIVHSILSILIFSFIFSWIVEKYIKKIEKQKELLEK